MTGFNIKLENSKILKVIVEALSNIIDETEFKITPDEFTISAMDTSRICLLKLTIKKEDFDSYNCDGDFQLGLNLDDLDKILKRSNTNDSLELTFKEKEQKIKIKMKREDSSRTRTFSLALLDIEIEEIPMERLLTIEYLSNFVFNSDILIEALKDAEIYSDIINVKATPNEGVIFTSTGSIGEMEYNLELEDLLDHDLDDPTTGAYSLEYLKNIMKLSSITEKMKISLKTDHPLRIFFSLLEGGELYYFLAPRVEEAEFEDDNMDEF